MYRVAFRSQRGSLIETGVCLVCAQTASDAEQSVSGFAGFPPATATFETSRVKPSIYELSRHETDMKESIPFLAKEGEEPEPAAVHEVRISAKVFAFSESSVLRRLAHALVEHVAMRKSAAPKHVNELQIEIDRADHRPRPSRIDEQSIYKEKRFFAGGAARPR